MASSSPAVGTHTYPGVRPTGARAAVLRGTRWWWSARQGRGSCREQVAGRVTQTSHARPKPNVRFCMSCRDLGSAPLGCLLSPTCTRQFASPERSCCREAPSPWQHVARAGQADRPGPCGSHKCLPLAHLLICGLTPTLRLGRGPQPHRGRQETPGLGPQGRCVPGPSLPTPSGSGAKGPAPGHLAGVTLTQRLPVASRSLQRLVPELGGDGVPHRPPGCPEGPEPHAGPGAASLVHRRALQGVRPGHHPDRQPEEVSPRGTPGARPPTSLRGPWGRVHHPHSPVFSHLPGAMRNPLIFSPKVFFLGCGKIVRRERDLDL